MQRNRESAKVEDSDGLGLEIVHTLTVQSTEESWFHNIEAERALITWETKYNNGQRYYYSPGSIDSSE